MPNKTKRPVLVQLVLFLLIILLSGCAKIYFYKIEQERVHYSRGEFRFYISDITGTVSQGKTLQYHEDSVYSEYQSRALRFKDIPFDSSSYHYLSLVNSNYPKDERLESWTYLIADSIKIIPKSPFEFPEYDGLEQITVRRGRTNAKKMWIEPILVPREYKDDFEIEYILSIYKKSDSTLLVRKPIKLKVKYASRGDSYFWGGR